MFFLQTLSVVVIVVRGVLQACELSTYEHLFIVTPVIAEISIIATISIAKLVFKLAGSVTFPMSC